MKRTVPGAFAALALILGLLGSAARVDAAATVHRFNLELGAGATQIAATNFNEQNEFFNRTVLEPRGLDGLERMTFSFLYDAGFRFFLRQNVALRAGVGQMRTQTTREYQPAIRQNITLRSEIFSVPMHIGADYYFAPFNQGDFQARAFAGGGLLNMVENRVLFQSYELRTDPTTALLGTTSTAVQRDAPGWYGEFGVHMFFAMRSSVVINTYYRNAKARGLVYSNSNTPALNPSDRRPFELDLSGLGGRGALCIGF